MAYQSKALRQTSLLVLLPLLSPGADIIGVNCGFDPDTTIKSIAMLREGLSKAGVILTQSLSNDEHHTNKRYDQIALFLHFGSIGLSAYMMCQPCGFHCQEAANLKKGFYNMPEYPYALGKAEHMATVGSSNGTIHDECGFCKEMCKSMQ